MYLSEYLDVCVCHQISKEHNIHQYPLITSFNHWCVYMHPYIIAFNIHSAFKTTWSNEITCAKKAQTRMT